MRALWEPARVLSVTALWGMGLIPASSDSHRLAAKRGRAEAMRESGATQARQQVQGTRGCLEPPTQTLPDGLSITGLLQRCWQRTPPQTSQVHSALRPRATMLASTGYFPVLARRGGRSISQRASGATRPALTAWQYWEQQTTLSPPCSPTTPIAMTPCLWKTAVSPAMQPSSRLMEPGAAAQSTAAAIYFAAVRSPPSCL